MVLRGLSRESVTIEWKPPLDDGGLPLTKYAIERREGDVDSWVKVADVDRDVDTYCVQRLNENSEYMFRVMAQNPIGCSDALESGPIIIKTALGMSPNEPPQSALPWDDTSTRKNAALHACDVRL